MKIFVQLAIIIYLCCGLIVVGAMIVGRRSSGLSVGYQVAGDICTLQLIDTDRPSNSYAVVSKRPFCLLDSAWSPNHRYAAIRNFPTGSLSIATGRNGSAWQGVYDFENLIAAQGSLVWSADSQQLAFMKNTNVTVLAIMRMVNGVPENPRLFTISGTKPLSYSPLAWSADGQYLAFAAYDPSLIQGGEELYILNVSSGEVRRLTSNSYRDDSPSWSPDGSQLVFTSAKDGYNELHIINVATGERHPLTRFIFGYAPSWSADGKRILFMSNMDYGSDLYVIGTNGMGLRRLTSNHYTDSVFPIWLFSQ